MISYGPVPSRRLGRSLGINNIPSVKVCPYSCIYCQVGLTRHLSTVREDLYDTEVVFTEVSQHLSKLKEQELPDYLTIVANGEPTLDRNLGKTIARLKNLNIPVAVITNAALLWQEEVRVDLNLADWVSVKVDTADRDVWKVLNRPNKGLDFNVCEQGLLQFSSEYQGKLATETMLVAGVNDATDHLYQTAELVARVKPSVAYISVPTRPPSLSTVRPPDESVINEAYQIYTVRGLKTELLLGFEGVKIGYTGNALEDILNTCSVHPLREDAMTKLLERDHAEMYLLESLINGGYIQRVTYQHNRFYIRKFHV